MAAYRKKRNNRSTNTNDNRSTKKGLGNHSIKKGSDDSSIKKGTRSAPVRRLANTTRNTRTSSRIECGEGEVDLGWGDCNTFDFDFNIGIDSLNPGCMESGCYSIEETTQLHLTAYPFYGYTCQWPCILDGQYYFSYDMGMSNLEANIKVSGNISREIGRLVNLTSIHIFGTGLEGEIPVEIGNLVNLEYLALNGHGTVSGQLKGPIFRHSDTYCDQWSNSECNEVEGCNWDINNNCISNGHTWIESLTNLKNLQMKYQKLGRTTSGMQVQVDDWDGGIPPEIGNLTNLTDLHLHSNRLEFIPPEMGNLTNLRNLNLAWNRLSGELPIEFFNLENLEHLDLYSNCIGGYNPLPPEIGNLTNIEYLRLSRNAFRGPLPSEIGNLTNLTNLRLYWQGKCSPSNQFDDAYLDQEYPYIGLTGDIPSTLGNLTNLWNLDLSRNQIGCYEAIGDTGNSEYQIPKTGCSTYCYETDQCHGTIPDSLQNLVNLGYLDLSANYLTCQIPEWICDLTHESHTPEDWEDDVDGLLWVYGMGGWHGPFAYNMFCPRYPICLTEWEDIDPEYLGLQDTSHCEAAGCMGEEPEEPEESDCWMTWCYNEQLNIFKPCCSTHFPPNCADCGMADWESYHDFWFGVDYCSDGSEPIICCPDYNNDGICDNFNTTSWESVCNKDCSDGYTNGSNISPDDYFDWLDQQGTLPIEPPPLEDVGSGYYQTDSPFWEDIDDWILRNIITHRNQCRPSFNACYYEWMCPREFPNCTFRPQSFDVNTTPGCCWRT